MPFVIPITTIVVFILFGVIVLNSQGRGRLPRTYLTTPSPSPSIQDVICDCRIRELCEADVTSGDTDSLNTIQSCGYEGGVEKVCCPIVFYTHISFVSNNESSIENSTSTAEVSVDFPYLPDDTKSESDLDFDYEDDSTRKISPKFPKGQILGENQVSYKAHENFKLLPTWKECGMSALSSEANNEVTFDDYPWIVQIGYRADAGEVQYKCIGSLISQKYVLASANCNQNGIPSEILVKVPQGTSDNKFARFEVASSISHKSYNRETLENDISLHRISIPDKKTLEFTPSCLPFASEYGLPVEDFMDKSKLVGFSTDTINNAVSITHDIQEFAVSIQPMTKCNSNNNMTSSTSNDLQICVEIAQSADGNTCNAGEIDGLVFARMKEGKSPSKYVHIGISSTPVNCLTNQPGKFTRLSKYLEWILDSIES